jgi:hypothetical protein
VLNRLPPGAARRKSIAKSFANRKRIIPTFSVVKNVRATTWCKCHGGGHLHVTLPFIKMRKKYLIITVSIFVGLALLAFNRVNLDIYESYSLIMDVQLVGLGIVFISFLSIIISKTNKLIPFRILLIFIGLLISTEIAVSYDSLQELNRRNFINKYSSKDCNQLLEQLEIDKTRNKFAYFSWGLVTDTEGIKNEFKRKYNAEVIAIGQGCSFSDEKHCYNTALIDFLEKRNTNGNNR